MSAPLPAHAAAAYMAKLRADRALFFSVLSADVCGVVCAFLRLRVGTVGAVETLTPCASFFVQAGPDSEMPILRAVDFLAGALIFTQVLESRVLFYSCAGVLLKDFAPGQHHGPGSCVAASTGVLYVHETKARCLRAYRADESVLFQCPLIHSTGSMAISPDETVVYITNAPNRQINCYSASTGALVHSIQTNMPWIEAVRVLSCGRFLIVGQTGTSTALVLFDAAGLVVVQANLGIGFNKYSMIEIDAADTLYCVTDRTLASISFTRASPITLRQIALAEYNPYGPTGVCIDGAGRLVVQQRREVVFFKAE
jgi:hypothetical protein